MTVSSATRKAGPFDGNGVTTTFPFTFKVFSKDDVQVVLTNANGADTPLALDADYSITLNGDQNGSPGGSVTYPLSGSPLPSGSKLTLTGDLPNLQLTNITNQGGFYPEIIETMVDRATIQIQQLAEELARSIRVSVSDASVGLQLPNSVARASTTLGFDANGNLTVLPIPASVGAGDLRNETFTSGVDFTPDISTSLLLSRSYGTAANISVFFDGAFQGPDQIASLNGNVLTFTAPIPSGVQKVYVKGGTTLSLSLPPLQSIIDTMLAAGSKIYNRANNWIDVKDYGAKGDGVTDDTAAVQAAINAAAPFPYMGSTRATELHSVIGTVYFPSGTYKVSSKIRLAPGLHLLGDNATTDYPSRDGVNGVGTGGIKRFGSCIYSTFANQQSYALDTSPWSSTGTRSDDYLQTAADSSAGTHTQMQGIVIENMSLIGAWTCRGLNLAGADTFRLKNVFIKGFNVGVRCSAVWYGRAENVTIESNYRAWINAIGCTDVQLDNCALRNGVDGVTYSASASGREPSDPPTTTNLTQAMLDQNVGVVSYYSTISSDNTALENFQTAILSSNTVDRHTNLYVEGISDVVLRVANFDGQNGYYHFDTINPNGASCDLLWCSLARVEVDCNWTNYTPGNYRKLIGFLNAPGNSRDLIPIFNARFTTNAGDTLGPQFYRKRPDDYNVGNWTPSLSFGGNSAGTPDLAYGRWHRIGNRVFCDFNIHIATLSGATGQALISGLPFNSDTTTNHISVGVVGYSSNSPSDVRLNITWNSGATASLVNSTGVALTNSGFSNGVQLAGSFSYEVQAGQ
ncbi:glycosyl hydrolase family 28-related protein [Caballeronia sp. LZ029]|uniref:glycosyl hydrolase family 28-related protein n=1 Tax=Caballeronia sp. LZ029 TaxID=3038564 RepID=UPI00285B0B22|nr:glycosyl hydrolase family 28-related protein [Caballeronia sp. LZ029]MDR5743269.1 glycosyl hydrolase family 28-related protein [Caballeronia sp. LZ029]